MQSEERLSPRTGEFAPLEVGDLVNALLRGVQTTFTLAVIENGVARPVKWVVVNRETGRVEFSLGEEPEIALPVD